MMNYYFVKQPACTPGNHVFTWTGSSNGPHEPDPLHRCDCGALTWQQVELMLDENDPPDVLPETNVT